MAQYAAEQEAVYYGATWKKSAFVSVLILAAQINDKLKTTFYPRNDSSNLKKRL